MQELRTAYPDLHITLDLLISESDWVAYYWTMRGTHELEVQVSWTGTTFNRVVDGKIVEDWVETDRLTILHQLGVFPDTLLMTALPMRDHAATNLRAVDATTQAGVPDHGGRRR